MMFIVPIIGYTTSTTSLSQSRLWIGATTIGDLAMFAGGETGIGVSFIFYD
jgi:hypothetical protein